MNDGGFMAISSLNPDIILYTGNVYDSAYAVAVSHSSDGGETWEHDTVRMGTRGWSVAFDGVDTNRIYVGGDSAYSYPCLLVTADRGATWAMSRSGLSGTVNALLTVPDVANLVYAGTSSGVFISTDAGATWEGPSLSGSVRTIVCNPANPQNLFVGAYGNGVSVTEDGGASWTDMNDGLTCNKVLSLAFREGSENTIYAGTEGGSVFKATLPAGLTSPSLVVPRRSPLAVSPNPSRQVATVHMNSPLSPARASVLLYDALGRLVRTYTVAGASLELRTSELRPGTYFVRLATETETCTARLTVLR